MSEYTSKEITKLACEALADKKADDIKVIDISEVSSLADYFVIAGGMNRNQVQAMADNVEETLGRKLELSPKQIEGYSSANWVLMDYRDVVIHIFDQENRRFYDLARIWRDGKEVDIDEPVRVDFIHYFFMHASFYTLVHAFFSYKY